MQDLWIVHIFVPGPRRHTRSRSFGRAECGGDESDDATASTRPSRQMSSLILLYFSS